MGVRKDQLGKALGITPVVLAQTSTPSLVANTVLVYAKDVDGISELFILDDAGNEVQITSGGQVNGGGGGGLFDNWWNASSNADGSFSGNDSIYTAPFNAEWNRINKWDGTTLNIVATLPLATTADHNRVLSFYEANDGANTLQIDTQGGQVFRFPGSGGGGPTSTSINGNRTFMQLQYDASTTHWTIIHGSTINILPPV